MEGTGTENRDKGNGSQDARVFITISLFNDSTHSSISVQHWQSLHYEEDQCDNCRIYTWNIMFCNLNTVQRKYIITGHETQVTQQKSKWNIYHLLNSSVLSSLHWRLWDVRRMIVSCCGSLQSFAVGNWIVYIRTNILFGIAARLGFTHVLFHFIRLYDMVYGPGI
jgi:hypothetical protein